MTAADQPGGQPSPSYAGRMGLVLDSAAAAEVRAHIDIDERHHMSRGIVHGGVYATIVESVATAGAAAALREVGGYAVGVNNQTDFLRPHRSGRLDIVACPIQQGRRLQLWQVEIRNATGKLVSRGQVRLFNQYPVDDD